MATTPNPKSTTEKANLLSQQLSTLPTLKMPELWALWDQYFNSRPKHPNRTQVESRLAYRMQETVFGGIKTETRNLLADFGERHSKIKTSKCTYAALLPGTVLLREFDGQEYRVTVTPDKQFEWAGSKYRSLSAIAKRITGTQWSGPAFFGLIERKNK
jgi:hypothetical protein